jgi:hypothetical protein
VAAARGKLRGVIVHRRPARAAFALAAVLAAAPSCAGDREAPAAADAAPADAPPPTDALDAGASSPNADDAGSDAAFDLASEARDAAPACPAPTAVGTLAELLDPASPMVAQRSAVAKVGDVVATSAKFLLARSKLPGGPCTYALFVADPNRTFAPYSGILVIAKGHPASGSAGSEPRCSGGGLIAEDVRPGDRLALTGLVTTLGPSAATCAAAVVASPPPAMPQRVLQICAYERTGTAGVPAPVDVAATDIDDQAATLGQWQSGLVRLTNVTVKSASAPTEGSLGGFALAESATLRVTNALHHRGAATAPAVKPGDRFASIVGLSYLDFCVWSLAPRSLCDHAPVPGDPAGCPPGLADAGP